MKFPDEIQTVATVLVVDGNRPEWDWIGRAIGETCRFAASIESGLTQAHEWLPSVIVLCEQVQRDSGVVAMAQFRDASPRSQIVVTAAEYDERGGHRALDAGAFTYVSKLDADLLRAAVLAAAELSDPPAKLC